MEKRKLLVIEDNIETQLIFKVYLREYYDVEIAENAEIGMELIEEKPYNLLILDINLPGSINGEDVLKKLDESSSSAKFPIIVVTAYALKGDREKYINMGAKEFLSKPIDKTILLKSIENALS
jgi:DNA-binding response OmpR family regulator